MATATGKVRIEGSAATGQIERAVTRIRGDFEKLNRSASKLTTTADRAASGFQAFVGAIAAEQVLRSFADLIRNTVDARLEIRNLALEAGTSAKLFGTLKEAADRAGASTDQISGAFKSLTARIGEAATNNKQVAAEFEDLGVALRDGNKELRGTEEVFRDVIRELGNIENETERAATASRFFGEAAFGLKRALGELSEDGLRVAEERAAALTARLGEDGIKAAEEFEQASNKVRIAARSLGDMFTDTLAPAVHVVIDPLVYLSVFMADVLHKTVGTVTRGFSMWGEILYATGKVAVSVANKDLLEAKNAIDEASDALSGLAEEGELPSLEAAAKRAAAVAASFRLAAGEAEGLGRAARDAGSDFALTNEQLGLVDPLTGEIIQQTSEAIGKIGQKSKEAADPVTKVRKEVERITEAADRFNVTPFFDFGLGAQFMNGQIAEAAETVRAFGIVQEEYARQEAAQIEASIERQQRAIEVRQSALESAAALGSLVQRIAGFYLEQATASGELSEEQRRAAIAAFNVQKAAGIATAIVNTAIGVTQALASAPPPANFVSAALVGAAGAVSIAEIAAQQPSFALGGVMPTTGSPAILHPGEGVLSAGAVDAIGGASALAGANARRGGGGQVVTVQWKHLRSSFYNEARDGSRRPGALRDLRRDGRRAGQKRYTMREDFGAL